MTSLSPGVIVVEVLVNLGTSAILLMKGSSLLRIFVLLINLGLCFHLLCNISLDETFY